MPKRHDDPPAKRPTGHAAEEKTHVPRNSFIGSVVCCLLFSLLMRDAKNTPSYGSAYAMAAAWPVLAIGAAVAVLAGCLLYGCIKRKVVGALLGGVCGIAIGCGVGIVVVMAR